VKDRGDADYQPIFQRIHNGDSFRSDVAASIGSVRIIALMSPSRQADKALALSGRQRVKRRKALRREVADGVGKGGVAVSQG